MQVVYDGLVLLLGPPALEIDAPGRLDALRKKLRGLTLLDSLITDDSLVPCMMLQAPQVSRGYPEGLRYQHLDQHLGGIDVFILHCADIGPAPP